MPEGINSANVSKWLQESIPGLTTPVEYSLIAGGHSNLTYQCLDASAKSYVLRRPPLGHVLESAHDMAREYRIISALQGIDLPVPITYGVCEDVSVNEAPFYVMEYVEGVVLHDSVTGSEIAKHERHKLGLDVIEVLANLHLIDPDKQGLGQLGRKEAYLTRQQKRWTKQWEASKTHEVPEMEACAKILAERMPDQIGATLVHGDYRLGNLMINNGKVAAILDWELCTLGDPLADVGYLLNNWVAEGEIEPREGDIFPTSVGGYPNRDQLCEIYSNKTGRDLSEINYYRAFSHWRLAAIGQGVYKRYLVGAMGADHDVDLVQQKENVSTRAAAALELLS